MLCPSCNGLRPANNAPCPLCRAPSPLVNEAWNGQNASLSDNQNQATFAPSWSGPGAMQNNWSGSFPEQVAFPPAQFNFGGSGSQPLTFSQPQPSFGGSGIQQISPQFGQQAFAQPPDGSDNSFWSQNRVARDTKDADNQQSLLPALYQDQSAVNEQALSRLPTGFPTIGPGVQQVNSLVPAIPDSDQEAPVYVAPMYTKPRPIIPRYRAISGLISFIIVIALLCTGAGYYAQVTGKLVFFEKLFGNYTPPSIASTQHTLQVPSNQVLYGTGPATKVIYSVGISTSENNGLVPAMINQFTVGQTIWLVCGANPSQDAGTISVKWYTNNHFYQLSTSDPLQAKRANPVTAVFHIAFAQPAEGKAEIYWNNQLAATVLFVVQPSA